MLNRLAHLSRTLSTSPFSPLIMTNTSFPSTWHTSPSDSFHGKITSSGPFQPEKDRYHLYVGLFCPFAHRALFVSHLKQLEKYAGIKTSIVKPYPKGDDNGWPGWQFNVEGEEAYEGATVDHLFGSKYAYPIYSRCFDIVDCVAKGLTNTPPQISPRSLLQSRQRLQRSLQRPCSLGHQTQYNSQQRVSRINA